MNEKRKRGRETLERKPAQIKMARLLEEMKSRPMTTHDVAEFLPVSLSYARRVVLVLHKEKKIRIAKWVRLNDCGPWSALYSLGSGKDAPIPKSFTKAEVSKRQYKKRKKEQPEEYAVYLARARARYWKGRIKPDPLTAWIPKKGEAEREAA